MVNNNPHSSYTVPFLGIVAVALVAVITMLIKSQPPYPVQWVAKWKMVQGFSLPRRALAAVAAHSHLYVIGGVDNQGNYVKTVEYAPLSKDGEVGPWQPTSALQQGRIYLAAVALGRHIYALGGGSGPIGEDNQPVASVERATINPDGSLSPWQVISTMQLPRRGLKAATVNNRIYAIGGYSGVFLKSIEHTLVDASGNLGTWQVDPEQARLDRYIHSAASFGDRLYLLGGHVQRPDQISYGDVESATIHADGFLSHWSIEKSHLQQPRFIASAVVLGKWLYMLGGHNGGRRLTSVEYTPILRTGHVGDWHSTTPLNVPRSAAAAVTWGNFIYVLGGMGDRQALNAVEMATAASNGELGYISQ